MKEKVLRVGLTDTVELMESSDYKDRFVAEYAQTKIRYEKLKAFNNKIEAARRVLSNPFECRPKDIVEPKHDCPEDLLRDQQSVMGQYLHILEVRAEIEGIDLEERIAEELSPHECGGVPNLRNNIH